MPRSPLRFLRTLNYLAFLPLASRAPMYGRLLTRLLADDRIPPSTKAVLALAAGYLASPIDVIPEGIPFLGAMDDLVVVVLALDVFFQSVPQELLSEKLEEAGIDRRALERDLEQMRRVVPRPVRAAARRLPGAIEGVFGLIGRTGLDSRARRFL